MANECSKECIEVLEGLAAAKNLLISGPPGTGKTRLLGEVAQCFAVGAPQAGNAPTPMHKPQSAIPIPPATLPQESGAVKAMPCPDKKNRKVFRTVFHQNSKNRDFVTGMIPNVTRKAGEPDFVIIQGTLYQASEHAKRADGAALLIIDEINRGPAVQVFGGSIVAIEADKRLATNGQPKPETAFFDLLDPSGVGIVPYALPDDLYILAAMNLADASVEPLDVAFLRRWEPYVLEPSTDVLRASLGISGGKAIPGELPAAPTEPRHVFEASVRAWEKVNRRISLGRGAEFQIGHGILMNGANEQMTLAAALQATARGWVKVRTHVQEVFFGDLRGIAATLNAINGPDFHPLRLEELTFADDLRFELSGPARIEAERIYDALRAIALD